MSGRTRAGLSVIAAAVVLSVAAACGGTDEQAPRPPTPTVMPTAAPGTPSVQPTAGASTPTSVRPTAVGASPTSAAASAGNVARGKTLFTDRGCVGCHSTSEMKLVGPGLGGLKDRAGSVVAGLSADAYIEQSIRQPNAHVVVGYPPSVMPANFSNLSEQDMKDLVAYLNSL